MCHASLVAHESCQVNWLLRVVLREGLDLAAMARGALAREETKRAVTRVLVLLLLVVIFLILSLSSPHTLQ